MRMRMAGVLGLLVLGAGCSSTKVLQRDGCWVRETKKFPGQLKEEVGPCARPAPTWSEDRLTRLVQECVAQDDHRWQARALAAWGRGDAAPERTPDQQVLEACMTQATLALNSEKEAVTKQLAEAQAQLSQVSQERDALEARLTSEREAQQARLEKERQAQQARLEQERQAPEARLEKERVARVAQLEQEREYLRSLSDKDRSLAAKEREALRASAERDRAQLHENGKLLAKELGESGKLMAKALGEGAKRPTPTATATATATSTGTGRALTESDLKSDTKSQTPASLQAPGNTAVVPVYPPVMYAPQATQTAPVQRTKRVTAPKAPVCPPGTVPVTPEAKSSVTKAPAASETANVCAPEPAKLTTAAAPETKPAPATGGSGD